MIFLNFSMLFLLFLKISKTNFYLFFKNCSLFNFIFLSENREQGQTVLWILKKYFLFLKIKNNFLFLKIKN